MRERAAGRGYACGRAPPREHRAPLVARRDQFEQDAGLGLILGDVSNVVEDEQVVAVELGDRGLERQLAPRRLQALDQIGGADEQDTPAVLDEGAPQWERLRLLRAAE